MQPERLGQSHSCMRRIAGSARPEQEVPRAPAALMQQARCRRTGLDPRSQALVRGGNQRTRSVRHHRQPGACCAVLCTVLCTARGLPCRRAPGSLVTTSALMPVQFALTLLTKCAQRWSAQGAAGHHVSTTCPATSSSAALRSKSMAGVPAPCVCLVHLMRRAPRGQRTPPLRVVQDLAARLGAPAGLLYLYCLVEHIKQGRAVAAGGEAAPARLPAAAQPEVAAELQRQQRLAPSAVRAAARTP